MMFMLDTNICIHLMKHTQSVLDKFNKMEDNNMAISSITLAELEFGISYSTSYEKNRAKLISFLPLVEVLSFDASAALEYGMIRAKMQKIGTLIGQLDMLIAAHAKSEGLTLVTNNTREFGRVDGLQFEDWL